jgi:hypothetical protein
MSVNALMTPILCSISGKYYFLARGAIAADSVFLEAGSGVEIKHKQKVPLLEYNYFVIVVF